jgi:riboflavin kinase / FMN adenylyltransferase
MQIIHDYQHCPKPAKQSVIALGNFDGMHKGHQKVIQEAKKIAAALHAPLAVLTFDPHPTSLFTPNAASFHLTTLQQKAELMASLGVNYLFVIPFTLDFSRISAQDFVSTLLVKTLEVRHVVTGYNFIFGHQRLGNADLLYTLAQDYHFGFSKIDAVTSTHKKGVYSSTTVRQLIASGDVQGAHSILGRYFSLAGTVVAGNAKGRLLGFPTANLPLGDYIHPKLGVYASTVQWGGKAYPSVSNIGRRPTLGGTIPLLETHLFHFDQNLYDQYIEVALIEFLREERRFNSTTELTSRIADDCIQAKKILGIT